MEAKLIKVQDKYWLTTDKQTDFCYHLGHKEILKVSGVGEKSGEVHHEKGWNKPNEVVFIDTELSAKLSLKNCQAIERGYDLDELAFEYGKQFAHSYNPEDFIAGAKAILELLGDKKFSEEDIKKIINWSTLDKDVRLSEEELFKSLQQTEWDVTFDPDEKDSEGQLILKRKL